MSKRTLTSQLGSLFSVLCLLLVLPTVALAGWGGHGAAPGMCGGPQGSPGDCLFNNEGQGGCHAHMAEMLDLTDDQQASMDRIFAEHRAAFDGKRGEAQELHESLAKLVHSDDYDAAAIQQIAEEMAAIHAAQIVERAGMMNQLFQLLTPEQVERFEELHAQKGDATCAGAPGPKSKRRHGHGAIHHN